MLRVSLSLQPELLLRTQTTDGGDIVREMEEPIIWYRQECDLIHPVPQ